jgi:Flp pilus assembly pilin Flp
VGVARRAVLADIESMKKLLQLPAREEGQTMAEYGTVLTVITVACLSAFVLLATSATSAYTGVASLFS